MSRYESDWVSGFLVIAGVFFGIIYLLAIRLSDAIDTTLEPGQMFLVQNVPVVGTDSTGAFAIQLAGSAYPDLRSEEAFEQHANAVVKACGVEILRKEPLWSFYTRYGPRSVVGGPAPSKNSDLTGIQVEYRIPESTKLDRERIGMPLDIPICAFLNKLSQPLYFTDFSEPEHVRTILRIMAERQVQYRDKEGSYATAEEFNLAKYQSDMVRFNMAPVDDSTGATPSGLALWGYVPTTGLLCRSDVLDEPKDPANPYSRWSLRCTEGKKNRKHKTPPMF